MFNKFISLALSIAFLTGLSVISISAQTISPDAAKIKAKITKRADSHSRTKIKLHDGTTYLGVVSDPGDTSFTVTSKTGDKHVVQYSSVRSASGLGFGTGAKVGIGIGIGVVAVFAVLAAIVASDN